MAKIHQVEPIVQRALMANPATRKDNFILYIEVLRYYIDTRMPMEEVFKRHKELRIPALETITRCRRKLQERYPIYRDEKATAIREEEEKEFIEYAHEE